MATRRTARSRRTSVPDLRDLGWFKLQEIMLGRAAAVGQFEDEEAMEAVWDAHRDELRERWAAEHAPGTRCFAEWLFEIVPAHGERPTREHWTREHERHRDAWLTHGVLHTHGWPNPLQVPEHVFLHEHGLIGYREYEEAAADWREKRENFEAVIHD